MTPDRWQNLAIAALLFVYAAQIALELAWGNLFANLAVDFASFWSAGRIANQSGYEAVYDLRSMAEVQSQLMPARATALAESRAVPTPFLPIFIVPFQLLALLAPQAAALSWMALNLVGTVTYLRHFSIRTSTEADRRALMLLIVSVPVFLNLFLGQANLWLMICVGEFLLAWKGQRPFVGGLWLGGLLLKPQTLLLIVPVILLRRWHRTALGLLVSGAGLVIASWLLAGAASLQRLTNLWLGYVGGLPTNDPQLMMNWRMLGVHLESLTGGGPALALVAAASLFTIAAVLYAWMRSPVPEGWREDVAFVGLMAGTALIAWHSHVHMAMIMIPPLMLVFGDKDRMEPGVLRAWVLAPAAVYVLRIMLAALTRVWQATPGFYEFLDLLAGIGLLGVDLLLVIWMLRRRRQSEGAAV